VRRCRDRRGVDADYDNGITLPHSLHCWWSDGGHALEALELGSQEILKARFSLSGKRYTRFPIQAPDSSHLALG
jgi:hypothetical protein